MPDGKGVGWTDAAVPRTRTGRSRLEHRQGWQDAVWQGAAHIQKAQRLWRFSLSDKRTLTQDVSSASPTMTQTRMFEIRHRHGWRSGEMVIGEASNGTCANTIVSSDDSLQWRVSPKPLTSKYT